MAPAGSGSCLNLGPKAFALSTGLFALCAPLVQEGRVQRAQYRAVASRAGQGLDIVEDLCLHRVFGFGRGNCRLPSVLDWSLFGREEASAHVHSDRAKHECRRDATSVKDTAGRNHRYGRNGIDDLRDESHRTDDAAIAARFTTLRDNYIGTTLGR